MNKKEVSEIRRQYTPERRIVPSRASAAVMWITRKKKKQN